jgi:transglutaminase-like putative cysteine protease
MRLSIDHRTTYRFSTPQDRLVQRLRMTPENTHDQTIASWHIAVDCDARMRRHRDGFGNCTTMLYCEGPLDSIEITVAGEVVTSHSDGVLHGTHEPLPAAMFRRTTPLTVADDAIAAFAGEHADKDPIATLHALNAAVCEQAIIDRGRPLPGRTAAEAFGGDASTPRDLAHVFIAAARSIGFPARYVSGYCDLEGDHRPTPHAWADAHVDGLGWIGFDPTLGLSPEEHHVRVAVGLDATDAAPVSGSRLGEGDERLEVEVTVSVEG